MSGTDKGTAGTATGWCQVTDRETIFPGARLRLAAPHPRAGEEVGSVGTQGTSRMLHVRFGDGTTDGVQRRVVERLAYTGPAGEAERRYWALREGSRGNRPAVGGYRSSGRPASNLPPEASGTAGDGG